LPFDEIVQCNIGNPQQLKQAPITYFRQVTSLLEYPQLLDADKSQYVSKLYPQDVLDRAREMLEACDGNIGGYSHSQGIPFIRQHVADFLQRKFRLVP
jgi:alanine transaminase